MSTSNSLKVKLRHLNVLEAELTEASEDALRIALPIRTEGPAGDRAVLKPADPKDVQNTEQRWLGRMITNTLGELKKRANMCDSKGAMLKVDIDSEKAEVEKLCESKKRKLSEVAGLKEKVDALRKKVLGQISSQSTQEVKALRPVFQDEEETVDDQATEAAESESAILAQVPPLQERAKQCVEEMGARSEQLTERVESFRETTSAVRSFLQAKPSKVEQAIRQSQRGGIEAQGKEQGEEGGSKAVAAKAVPAPPAPASGIALLSEHLTSE